MFPHEEYLRKAIRECRITKLVQDLGLTYLCIVAKESRCTTQEFEASKKVCQILEEAAERIANLGGKPVIIHPLDQYDDL